MKKYDYLIIGAGLFGSVFTYRAIQSGKKVLVLDKRPAYRRKFIYGNGGRDQCP